MVTDEDIDRVAEAVKAKLGEDPASPRPQPEDHGVACPNLRPMKEWVAEEDPDSCRPCVLPVAMSWYYEELTDRGLGDLAQELDTVKDTGDPDQVAEMLDSIKERVDPEVKNRLLEFDCATQLTQVTAEDAAGASPSASPEPSPPDHHNSDTS